MTEREENLTFNQQKIYNELIKLDKKSGIAYIGAITVLKNPSNPDRFYQAANSIRHLGAIISRQMKVKIDEEEKKNLKKQLDQYLKDNELAEKYYIKVDVRESSLEDKLKIILVESPDILPKHSEKRINSLFNRWLKLHSYFTAIAHYAFLDIDPSRFDNNMKELENILLDIFEPPQEIIPQLDELIGIHQPSQEDVQKLIKINKHPSYTQYFFTRLESPGWIEPLNDNDFFSDPKDTQPHSFMISTFAPLSYLNRMASIAPEKILGILKKLKDTKNYRLYRQLLNCLTKMPTIISKESLDLIGTWMSQFSSISELVELKKLIKQFLEAKDHESVIKLLSIMLNVIPPKLRMEGEDLTQKLLFIYREFEALLDLLIALEIEEKSCEYLNLLCRTLVEINKQEFLKYKEFNQKKPRKKKQITSNNTKLNDNSHIWRPTIKSYYFENSKNIITDELLSLLEKLKNRDHELFIQCLEQLSKYDLSIFKRIQLYFYNKDVETFNDEIKEVLNNKVLILERIYWSEMFFILKNNYHSLNEGQKKRILEWIEGDYEIDLSNMKLSRKEKKKKKIEINRERKKRFLAPILEYLDEEYKEKHKKLISEIINTERPEPSIKIEAPKFYSPIDNLKNQILNKSIDELIFFLNDWTPHKNKQFSESKEDLGFALSRLIEENPSDYIELFDNIEEIPKVYISYTLKGFASANKNNKSFPYKSILNKSEKIIQLSENGEFFEDKIKLHFLEYIENSLRREHFNFSHIDRNKVLEFIEKCALTQEMHIEPYETFRNDLENKIFNYYSTVKGRAIVILLLYFIKTKEQGKGLFKNNFPLVF